MILLLFIINSVIVCKHIIFCDKKYLLYYLYYDLYCDNVLVDNYLLAFLYT